LHRFVSWELLTGSLGTHNQVNNAGVVNMKRQHTVDGHEETWAVNVLAPYALTELLLQSLKKGAASSGQASRVVNVGSDAYKLCKRLDLEDPCMDKVVNFNGFPAAYAHSKLALLALTFDLASRLRSEACSTVTVNCIHPGPVNTNLGNGAAWWAGALKATIGRVFLRPASLGCEGVLALCSEPRFGTESGQYYVDQGKAGRHAVATVTKPCASDAVTAKRLQQLCARMTQARTAVTVSPPSSPTAAGAKSSQAKADGAVAVKQEKEQEQPPAQPVAAAAHEQPASPPLPPVAAAAAAATPMAEPASDLEKAAAAAAAAVAEAAVRAAKIAESLRAASEAEKETDEVDAAAVVEAMRNADELRSPEEKAAIEAAKAEEAAKVAAAEAKAKADAEAAERQRQDAEARAVAEKAKREEEKRAAAAAKAELERKAAEAEAKALEEARAAAEKLRLAAEAEEGGNTAQEGESKE
jgi:NAD(P)-dependent dehydrogenase (short-subunit alcohol dehydrogenase family)